MGQRDDGTRPRRRLAAAAALLCGAVLIGGCGGGGSSATTQPQAASSTSSTGSVTTLAGKQRHNAARQAHAHGAASNQKPAPKTSAATKTKGAASPGNRTATSPYPHLPLVAGTPPNVTNKVGACFRAGHTGVWSSQPAGGYEVFGTTGPGGGKIEIVATHSAAVAARVGQAIAASGSYQVVGPAGKRSVAAVSKGGSAIDQALAIHCAALAG